MKRIAVIGLGNIATRHRRNLRLLFPEAIIYAMSSSGRKTVGMISDCDAVVADLTDLYDQLDMVIIASPATYHAQHAIPFIKAGIPTLIEKPVVASLEDASIITQVAAQHKTPIGIGYCLRYLPSAQKMHYFLASNAIGRALNVHISIGQYLPDWRTSKNYKECVSASKALGGGALLELSHEFDYARWLFGDLQIKHAIVRNSGTLDIDVEDIVDVVALSHNKTVIQIHLDLLQRQAHRKCEVIGTEGRLEWNLISNKIILHNSAGSEVIYEDVDYNNNEMYLDMLNDFSNLISGKENCCIRLVDSIKTIELIEEIRSMAE